MANSIFEIIFFPTSVINFSEPVPHAIEFLLIQKVNPAGYLLKFSLKYKESINYLS